MSHTCSQQQVIASNMVQLIVQNMYGTEWYFADEAQVYKSERAWMVYAKRLDDPSADVHWTVLPNNQTKTLQWIDAPATEIDRVKLNTFSSTIGEMLEYEVRLRDGRIQRLYSWMSNFVDAWNAGFQVPRKAKLSDKASPQIQKDADQ
jgi:hypothetical protein